LIRLANPPKSVPPPFIPENPSAWCKVVQGQFLNNKSADIIFEVGGEEQSKGNANKFAKTSSVTFPAHRFIVVNCSSIPADLCASSGGGDNGTTPVSILGVSPDIFHFLLSYIYGIQISNEDLKLYAREIINTADRFGITGLKLEADAFLVNNTLFSKGSTNLRRF
jgi:hypothetical protein